MSGSPDEIDSLLRSLTKEGAPPSSTLIAEEGGLTYIYFAHELLPRWPAPRNWRETASVPSSLEEIYRIMFEITNPPSPSDTWHAIDSVQCVALSVAGVQGFSPVRFLTDKVIQPGGSGAPANAHYYGALHVIRNWTQGADWIQGAELTIAPATSRQPAESWIAVEIRPDDQDYDF